MDTCGRRATLSSADAGRGSQANRDSVQQVSPFQKGRAGGEINALPADEMPCRHGRHFDFGRRRDATSSWMTMPSAPSGTGAPVEIRTAVPASQRPAKPWPAPDSPITVKSPGVSALRTA